MSTAERVKRWRVKRRLSLRAAGLVVGISGTHLARIEEGSPVGLDAAKKLAPALGVAWSRLVTESEDAPVVDAAEGEA